MAKVSRGCGEFPCSDLGGRPLDINAAATGGRRHLRLRLRLLRQVRSRGARPWDRIVGEVIAGRFVDGKFDAGL
jgi:hypothetical protein